MTLKHGKCVLTLELSSLVQTGSSNFKDNN
jgi:hypothetical protein